MGIITIPTKGAQLYITRGLKHSCEMSKIIQYQRGELGNICLINQVFITPLTKKITWEILEGSHLYLILVEINSNQN